MSLTIENLLNLLICEWQKNRYSPMGRPIGGVHKYKNATCITLAPCTMHPHRQQIQGHCPRNFKEFFEACKELHGLNCRQNAFEWYCKSRLYYSCSTVCVTFVEFIVPELYKQGITMLRLSKALDNNGGKVLNLKNIKMKEVSFFPSDGKIHCLRMKFSRQIEMNNQIEVGSHNTLECSETGIVVDPTLGQLTFSMKLHVFPNVEQYISQYKGEIVRIFDSPYEDIERQKQMNIKEVTIHKDPQIHPVKIAKRVVSVFLNSSDGGRSTYCSSCLGIASLGSRLLRCSKCKGAHYCSKTCQLLDWKEHKEVCQASM